MYKKLHKFSMVNVSLLENKPNISSMKPKVAKKHFFFGQFVMYVKLSNVIQYLRSSSMLI